MAMEVCFRVWDLGLEFMILGVGCRIVIFFCEIFFVNFFLMATVTACTTGFGCVA